MKAVRCEYGSVRDIDLAVELLALLPELPGLLISHRFPLDAARETFAAPRRYGAKARSKLLCSHKPQDCGCISMTTQF